jgi:hypothetical protein
MGRSTAKPNKLRQLFDRLFGLKPPEKIVLVSFPKSGRTWLRVMLDAAGVHIDYTHDRSGHQGQRHYTEMEHDKSGYKDRRVVLLVRDPRDVVVSGYFQATKRIGVYDGSISDFIRDPKHGIEKIIIFNSDWLASATVPKDFHLIQYEDMHTRLREVLTGVIRFADPKRRMPDLDRVMELGRFENMQEMENSGELAKKYGRILKPGDPADVESFKCRKGKVGGYADYLSEDDINYCNAMMEKYNYSRLLDDVSRAGAGNPLNARA